METTEKKLNDDINLKADTLIDLPVAEERADETKGGAVLRSGDGVDVLIGGAGVDR
jgi:hypothetical protein